MPILPKPDWCRQCPGWGWSEHGPGQGFSSLEGYGESGLFVVSEALGENEEDDGLPLRRRGAAGGVFRRALDELGLSSQAMTVTNTVRCRPPDNELWGHPYTFPAIDRCRHYLSGAVDQRRPAMLLALGDTPYQELVADRPGSLSEVRGFVLSSRYGMPLIATYHPAYIARGAWNLYGAFKQDIGRAALFARNGVPALLEADYALHPSLDDVRAFVDWLLVHPAAPIAYDVETAFMLGEKEGEDWRSKRLIQIQFSIRPGHAIVLPWDNAAYTELSRQILATPNPKWSWNGRLSDEIILKANGCVFGGEQYDLMLAWGHLQPDFSSKGDDRDGDEKGIPSKLMGLQSAASFYLPENGPWKYKAHENLQLYGAYDADYTMRCGLGIFRELEKLGLMAGYREHKYELRWVLDDLGEHGLPVDRDKQAALRVYTLGELTRLQTEIQSQVPAEVLSIHPKAGYKAASAKVSLVEGGKDPAEWVKVALKSIAEDYDGSNPPLVMAAGHVGYLVQKEFEEDSNGGNNRLLNRGSDKAERKLHNPLQLRVGDVAFGDSLPDPNASGQVDAGGDGAGSGISVSIERVRVSRWCIERLFNPHGSSPNTKNYIRHMGYRMPVNIATGEETTGRTELQKLAKETGDAVLSLIDDWRDLRKTGLDYTTGKWVPGEDGRIHPTFRCGTTGSGQTSCTDPNAQQYPEHSGIAKRAKEAIRAEPGYQFVKVDMRGFHSRAIGWLAGDPSYYKMADYDVHSFISAHFLNLHDAPYLIDMEDDELRAALGYIKVEHQHTRNYKVKRVVHGRQFNMGVRKLYQLHGQDFDPPVEKVIAEVGESRWYDWDRDRQVRETNKRGRREAQKLFNLFDELFPQTFVLYPAKVREQITNVTPNRLVTPFGSHRFFWSWDAEQSTAFGPSNCAHCHIQSALVRMRKTGALKAFGACNFTHDALWLHTPEARVRECVQTVQYEFELPSTVLVDSPLGPFQCNSDVEVGYDLAHMGAYA